MTIYAEIRAERERAHAKHGDKSMESWAASDYARLSILMEEVGEVAREFNEAEIGDRDMDLTALRTELVQVAAMAAAWADAIGNDEIEAQPQDSDGVVAKVWRLADQWDAQSDAEREFADRWAGYHAGARDARLKAATDLRATLAEEIEAAS